MKAITIKYYVFQATEGGDYTTPCAQVVEHEIVVFDYLSTPETYYHFLRDPEDPNKPGILCTWTKPDEDFLVQTGDFVRWLMADNRQLVKFPDNALVWSFEESDAPMPTLLYEGEMILHGGVDIFTLANYSESEMGAWFATLEVLSFSDNLISANLVANPNRYGFGEIALNYHGFVCDKFWLDRRKMYIPIHSWLRTLEPQGTPQEVNIWVPTPGYPRASGITWGLLPDVVGLVKVWSMKLLTGIDAYF